MHLVNEQNLLDSMNLDKPHGRGKPTALARLIYSLKPAPLRQREMAVVLHEPQ